MNWKDIGLNAYGNSLIVNGAFLEKNPKLVGGFRRASRQKAYAACVADFEPCLKALLDQVTGLDREEQLQQWGRIKYLMADEFTTTKGLGWIDEGRMKKDYDLVQTYLGMEKPFAVESAFTSKTARSSDQDGRGQGGASECSAVVIATSACERSNPDFVIPGNGASTPGIELRVRCTLRSQ